MCKLTGNAANTRNTCTPDALQKNSLTDRQIINTQHRQTQHTCLNAYEQSGVCLHHLIAGGGLGQRGFSEEIK